MVLVLGVYLLALAVGCVTLVAVPAGWSPLVRAAVADGIATLVVFGAGVLFRNASFYDPYWSVAPPVLMAYFFVASGADFDLRSGVVAALVLFWAVRLTANWARGWRGLEHEDWRYVDLQKSSGRGYFWVNLSGIHLFPTALVYLGCLPLWGVTQGSAGWNVLDGVAATITFGAVVLELVADEQKRRFLHAISDPKAVCERGVWSWSRHPNYLGEIGFWFGLWIFALAGGLRWWWTGVGVLAMTLLFIFISIPMLEKRQVIRRPSYTDYQRRVGVLLPRF